MSNVADESRQHAAEARRGDFTTTALLVEQDFRRLVETLKLMIRTAEPSDADLIERIACTKAVAQRGLRLSKLLTRLTRNPRD